MWKSLKVLKVAEDAEGKTKAGEETRTAKKVSSKNVRSQKDRHNEPGKEEAKKGTVSFS